MDIDQRSSELTAVIDKQITMTDDETELTLFALLMMNKARDILDRTRGHSTRKKLFDEFGS